METQDEYLTIYGNKRWMFNYVWKHKMNVQLYMETQDECLTIYGNTRWMFNYIWKYKMNV